MGTQGLAGLYMLLGINAIEVIRRKGYEKEQLQPLLGISETHSLSFDMIHLSSGNYFDSRPIAK